MNIFTRIKNKLRSLPPKKEEGPSYEFKRGEIDRIRLQYGTNIFVETGTFFGDTVNYFKSFFNKVYSIELSPDLAAKAKRRFESEKNIQIIEGDSGKILSALVKEIQEPVLFWLDGHYSSEFFVGEEFIKTGRGEKDTPVFEELAAILSSSVNHITLIDDARLFTGANDYPTIDQIRQLVQKLKPGHSVKVENDIIYIFY